MEGLRKQLEKMEWPAIYPFKFIVPVGKLDEVLALFLGHDTNTKISEKGNYASVTVSPYMYSAEKVLEIYDKAAKIEGLRAL
jgi:uncharacterized protein